MKKNLLKHVAATMMAMTMGMSLMACGNSGAGNDSANNISANNTVANDIAANSTAANNTAKQLSGKVVVYMPSPAGLNEKYIAAFEKKTGVKVELFEGTTGEISARLEAEKDNPVADVVVLASWSDGLSLKESGVLQSYTPQNADKLYDGWMDSDKMLFGTSASALGVIYNTTIIDKLDADWDELAGAAYKDQLAIPDPAKSGSCKDFLAGYITAKGEAAGLATWTNLAKNGLKVAGANKAALETVVTGEKAILVAGVDYNAYSSIAKGEPLGIYYPKSGTVINPRPAMLMKNSKNVDNGKAFIDFLLSDEAQKLVADAYLLPGRSDIKCTNRTNVSDIATVQTDWATMMKNASGYASKLNELCSGNK